MAGEPRAGDLVRVEGTDDGALIPPGTLGVITDPDFRDPEFLGGEEAVLVVFNFYTPWAGRDGWVSASGGPVRAIPRRLLRPTGEAVRMKFQRWKRLPGGDVEEVEREARVFSVSLSH